MKRLELSVLFTLVHILPDAIWDIEPSSAPFAPRSQQLYVARAHLVVVIERKGVLLQHFIREP